MTLPPGYDCYPRSCRLRSFVPYPICTADRNPGGMEVGMHLNMRPYLRLSKKRALYIGDEFGLLYTHGKLWACDRGFQNEKLIGKLPCGIVQSLMTKFFLTERMFRYKPRCAVRVSENEVIISCMGMVYLVDVRQRTIRAEHRFRHGMRNALRFCRIEGIPGFDSCVAYGEYWGNPDAEAVGVYCRSGGKWRKAYSFSRGSVLHIHGFCPDPAHKRVLILTGDQDRESGIWAAYDNFKRVEPVKVGSQQYRACAAFAFGDQILYATDTALENNALYLLNVDGSIQKIYDMPGPCIFASEFLGTDGQRQFAFATSVEPDSRISGIRYMLTRRLATGVKSRHSCLIVGDPAHGFRTALKINKDILPMGLFGFGNLLFPDNELGSLTFLPQGLRSGIGTYTVLAEE